MNQMRIGPFTRISKQAAKKVYDAGGVVYLTACKMNPASPWGVACSIKKDAENAGFNEYVNAFTYYNCSPETGTYPAYWMKGE